MKKQLKITDSLIISRNSLLSLAFAGLSSLLMSGCGSDAEEDTLPPVVQDALLQKSYSPFDTIVIPMSEGLNILDPTQQCTYNSSQYSINWSSTQANTITIFSKKSYGNDATNISQFKDSLLSISCANLSDKSGNTTKNIQLKLPILPIIDSDIRDTIFQDKNGIGNGADTIAIAGKFVKNAQDMKDSMVFAGYLTGKRFMAKVIDKNDFYLIQARAKDTIQIKLYGNKNSALTLEFLGPKINENTFHQEPNEKIETPNAQGVLELNAIVDANRQSIVTDNITTYQNYWIHVHFKDENNAVPTPYRLMIRRK